MDNPLKLIHPLEVIETAIKTAARRL